MILNTPTTVVPKPDPADIQKLDELCGRHNGLTHLNPAKDWLEFPHEVLRAWMHLRAIYSPHDGINRLDRRAVERVEKTFD